MNRTNYCIHVAYAFCLHVSTDFGRDYMSHFTAV